MSDKVDLLSLLQQMGQRPAPTTAPAPAPTGFYQSGGVTYPTQTPDFGSMSTDELQNLDAHLSAIAKRQQTEAGALEPKPQYGPFPSPEQQPELSKQYEAMRTSPYVSFADEGWAAKHPRIAGALDNALLVARAIKPPVDAAGRPIATGAGYGIGQVASAITGLPEQKLAYREQLAEQPLSYAEEQAKLGQTEAATAESRSRAISEMGSNLFKTLQQSLRNELAAREGAAGRISEAGIGAISRENVAKTAANARIQDFMSRDSTRLLVAQMQRDWQNAKTGVAQKAVVQRYFGALEQHIANLQKAETAAEALGDTATANRYKSQIEGEQAVADAVAKQGFGISLDDMQENHKISPTLQKRSQPKLPQGKGQTLTDPAVANQFLKAAGGDKNKARALAKKNGWVF